ncbi:hypothetical protein MBLNU459_g7022t1 [Dothideomycetes sp. NU459]
MSHQATYGRQQAFEPYSAVNTSYNKINALGSPEVANLSGSNASSPFTQKHEYGFFPPSASYHPCNKSIGTRIKDLANNYWVLELLAWLLSWVSLGVLLALLALSDKTWIADWPFSWKIASVIALISTFLKTTMMVGVVASLGQLKWLWFTSNRRLKDIETFDLASRGPLGALQFVFSVGFCHLSTLGALIVLLTLALDTMTQQVVTLVPGTMYNRGTAWMPRSTGYYESSLYSTGYVPGDQGPSTTMVGAIYEGYFAASSISNLKDMAPLYYCPSGNCTWGSVQTLGTCFRCSDLTSEIEVSRGQYRLPNGLSMSTSNGLVVAGGSDSLPPSSALTDVQPLISYFSAMSYNVTGLAEAPSAAECAIYWCVAEFNTSMTNANLTQTALNTWGNATYATAYGKNEDIYIFPDRCPLNGTDADVRSPDCTYSVGYLAQRGLQNFLPGFFNGSASWVGHGWSIDTETVQALYSIASGDMLASATDIMRYLCAYMTRNIRETSPWSNHHFQTSSGDVEWSELRYHVRWPWMILPSALVFLSSILLLVTIIRSRGYEKWKSSALAMMYNGIHEDHRLRFGPDASIVHMNEAAETMEYRLATGAHPKDYRLVKSMTHGSPSLTSPTSPQQY